MIQLDQSLSNIQQVVQELQRTVVPLQTGALDMAGRRVVNAGKPIEGFDYVRKLDLDNATKMHAAAIGAMRNTLLRVSGPIRVGPFAARGTPVGHPQQLFIATDHNYVAWISDAQAWHWQSGENVALQAGIAAISALLTSTDVGYILNVSDFSHRLQWSGSAWNFAEGDNGSYYFTDNPGVAPNGGVWQVCDGSTTTYLKPDGTTGSYTTLNTTFDPAATTYFRR